MDGDEALPFWEDVRAFREQLKEGFTSEDGSLNGGGVHPETVCILRPGGNAP
jgi:hypothetical protein